MKKTEGFVTFMIMNQAELNAFEDAVNSFKKLLDIIEMKKEEMRVHFRKMTREELVDEFRNWSDDHIVDACEWLALETEDYEICAAAKVVKDERGLNR